MQNNTINNRLRKNLPINVIYNSQAAAIIVAVGFAFKLSAAPGIICETYGSSTLWIYLLFSLVDARFRLFENERRRFACCDQLQVFQDLLPFIFRVADDETRVLFLLLHELSHPRTIHRHATFSHIRALHFAYRVSRRKGHENHCSHGGIVCFVCRVFHNRESSVP